MKIDFVKYHGAGNDFIIIDDYAGLLDLSGLTTTVIERLCHRHFGIGADGLMILKNHPDYDFEMVYHNSDGRRSSMCGNGGRCIVDLAYKKGILKNDLIHFLAADGPHEAKIGDGVIILGMSNVLELESKGPKAYFLDTGSPHFVTLVEDLDLDLISEAHLIRYSSEYKEKGTNVNFIKPVEKGLEIRTYERGVEDETLACGTGITAAVLAYTHHLDSEINQVNVLAKGGELSVTFKKKGNGWEDIWLIGPAQEVFVGTIDLSDIESTIESVST